MNKVLLLTAIASCLSACATYDASSIENRMDETRSAVPATWQVSMAAAQNPQDWQSLFSDPLLREYLARASASNFDIEQAEARLRGSEARLKLSSAALRPTINANLSASGFSAIGDDFTISDSFDNGLSARWDPDIFGANKARVRQASAFLDVQNANTERLRRVISAQTAVAYVRAVEADQQLELALENLDFLRETRRISTARFEAGDIARDDLSLSELEYENAQASVQTLEQGARDARRAIDILMGGFGSDDLRVSKTLPAAVRLSANPPSQILAARFDIAAARAALAAEVAAIEGVNADDWPQLTLSGGLGGGGASLGTLFDPEDYILSLSTALLGNIFDGGRNDAQIEAAEAEVDVALSNYAQTLRDAVFDVNSAFDRITTLERSLASLNRARSSADTALRLAKIKYDLGETILVDVLTVQRRVNSIKSSRIRTERQLIEAQIAAYLALGGNV